MRDINVNQSPKAEAMWDYANYKAFTSFHPDSVEKLDKFLYNKFQLETLEARKIPYVYNFLETNLCGDHFIIICSKIKFTPDEGTEKRECRFYLQNIMKKGFATKKSYI